MRILFFPSDIGGGFGHISRCLAIAHEAKDRGHNCAFVMNNNKFNKMINDFNIFIFEGHSKWSPLSSLIKSKIIGIKSPVMPLFTEFSGLDYQVVRDGLTNEEIIKERLNQYYCIVKRFKPDVLIGDTNLLVWILSQKVEVPLVQIVRYATHPKTAELFWWKGEPEGMIPPNTSDLFNPLLIGMGIEPIKRAADLLQGDLFIIPSISEIEPIPEDGKTVHVGELIFSKENVSIPSWFHEIDDNQSLIYITVGGGAGPVGNKALFSTIVDAFKNKPVQVVVSTSYKFASQDLPTLPQNIKLFKWVPGKFMISRADLVIFHGGYGTMMESIYFGKPSITIPFQSEQEGNGRRLEELGCGLVVKLSKEAYKVVKAKWEYGLYSFLIQNRYDLTPNELYRRVDRILKNNEYQNNAQRLRSIIKGYDGLEKTVELLEKY